MKILLTNDDGIYAPGLAAMEHALRRLGDVAVIAPSTEQSGVGHQITFLTPLTVKKLYVGDRHWGWTVDGTPADCVKLGITEICGFTPDLVVSGINGGLNAGINVLYSGTVAAAVEAGFFGITSVAVSLEMVEKEPFREAAELAVQLIEQLLAQKSSKPEIFNINIPVAALNGTPRIRVVPMDTGQYWELFERRIDPFGRTYFWLSGRPEPRAKEKTLEQPEPLTDLFAVANGEVAITPLGYDMTRHSTLREMTDWTFFAETGEPTSEHSPTRGPGVRTKRFGT